VIHGRAPQLRRITLFVTAPSRDRTGNKREFNPFLGESLREAVRVSKNKNVDSVDAMRFYMTYIV